MEKCGLEASQTSNAIPSDITATMLTIDIEEWQQPNGYLSRTLVVDGTPIPSSTAHRNLGRIETSLRDPDQAGILTAHNFADVSKQISRIRLVVAAPWTNLRCTAVIAFSEGGKDLFNEWREEQTLNLQFRIDIRRWAGPFSILDLRTQVGEAVRVSGIPGLAFVERTNLPLGEGFVLTCAIRDLQTPIQTEVSYWIETVRPLIQEAETLLAAEVARDTLVTLFDFPAPVRTACEQYLLYFAQFLQDLGIEADADVRHRAGHVLFSVKPKHGTDALDRIRAALDEYLQLPSAPGLDSAVASGSDIAVLQLQANIHHLKGQLAIAGAVLRARDAEIEALTLSNYQYRQMLAAAQHVDQVAYLLPRSLDERDESCSTSDDEEPLLGGVVKVVPYEGKGFKIDLPEILRRLRRRFTND